jgi:3-phosphoshikimate 1-carboxyvinyltransferase
MHVHRTQHLRGTIDALPSKNYTTRYLLAAALAAGTSHIERPAHSQDSQAMRDCLGLLGARISETGQTMVLTGFGRTPSPCLELNVGNAGAVLRFLLAVSALLPQTTFVNAYPQSLGKRPHNDLLDALRTMHVRIEDNDGKLPITVYGGAPRGGKISVSGNVSSQFLSALLFLTPLLEEDSVITVRDGLKSKPAVLQTIEVLHEAGIVIDASDDGLRFTVPGRQQYVPRRYVVQGDYPGSAAIMAACAVTSSDVAIRYVRAHSKQGERKSVDVLRAMGVDAVFGVDAYGHEQLRVRGGGPLKAIQADGDEFTDAVLACVAAAVFAEGTSVFYNVQNLRYKECDRITDFLCELRKTGAHVEETESSIIVHGRPEGVEGGVHIDAHYDHRVIMALTIVGLRARAPITICDAHHVAKSYPTFFDHLRALGARIDG